MNFDYKCVCIYADSNDNLLIIPNGESKKFWGAITELDIVNKLNKPYSDKDLENVLTLAMEQCYSLEPDDTSNRSSIEKYLRIKGYAKAVKGRRLAIFEWNIDDGYYITPTQKIPHKGFVHDKDKKIDFGMTLESGKLAEAVLEALKLSTTY